MTSNESKMKASEIQRLKPRVQANKPNISKSQNIDYLDDIFDKLQNVPFEINRLDYYGNSIPLGAFCFAVSFILYGFYESKIIDKVDKFTYSILFLFGGIGQITAGVFEYIKSRTFPTVLYLLYGIYFITFFLFNYYKDENVLNKDSKKVYFGSWAFLSFPVVVASFKINVIYILQNISVCTFFVIKCIGECQEWDKLIKEVSGILEMITGFSSLYICFSQVLNEHFKRVVLSCFPINKKNEIDIDVDNLQNNNI